MNDKPIQLKTASALQWDQHRKGWIIGSKTFILIPSDHPGFAENATYLVTREEHDAIIHANADQKEIGVLDVGHIYRCRVGADIYYAMGWQSDRWHSFGLHDAYWMMRSLNPNWHFLRRSEFEEYELYFRKSRFDALEPSIYSHTGQHDYFLAQDVHAAVIPCRNCGGPVCDIERGHKPYEIWWGTYWNQFKDRHRLQITQIHTCQRDMPTWLRFSTLVCSPECERILRKRGGRLIYERVETWAKQEHEKRLVRRLKKLMPAIRKATQQVDHDALRSLQRECEQAATSRN